MTKPKTRTATRGKKSRNQSAVTNAQNSAPKSAPGAKNACPCPKREITSITIKRMHINLKEGDYGHWWFEIDGKESYGWWPKAQVGLKGTFGGTDGELNGQTNFGGTATMDPHHGDDTAQGVDETFHPTTADGDCRTDAEIKDCLRGFAKSYSGTWRWTFGAGQNCHTFQKSAMKHCKLSQP